MEHKRVFTSTEILDGLISREFEVHYQPVIDKSKNIVISGEALLRWKHPKLGLLHPNDFIPSAEKTATIIMLGEFIFREACLKSKLWKDEGNDFYKVAVNLSMTQLMDNAFIDMIKRVINETGAQAEDMSLEITESIATVESSGVAQKIKELRDIGLKIYLDDFGTGYSSLNYLNYFPLDGLKIDGEFVRHSTISERGYKLIRLIINLAESLSLSVIAEGVETREQITLLQGMNCHLMQGFYFTHALPAKEYADWCLLFKNQGKSSY